MLTNTSSYRRHRFDLNILFLRQATMYSSICRNLKRLKRVVRRSKWEHPLPRTAIRPLSPEDEAPILLQRQKTLSIIFERCLHLSSGSQKPIFLLLPYEIRLQILEYCVCAISFHLVVFEKGGPIRQGINFNRDDVIRKKSVLSIPLTCRQL